MCVRFLAALTLAAAIFVPHARSDDAADRTAAEYLPEQVLIAGVFRAPDRALLRFSKLLERRDFAETKLYGAIASNTELTQARIMLLGIAASAGTDAWTAVASVLGREVAIGIAPDPGKRPHVVIVSILREPALADRLLESVLTIAGLLKDGEPDSQRSREVDGVTVYALDDDAFLCRLDDALVFANGREAIKAVLATSKGENRALADTAVYAEARRSVPDGAAAWGVVDLVRLRDGIAQAGEIPAVMDNPLFGFLFGGWYHDILHADAALAWATFEDDRLRLEARVQSDDALPDSHRGFSRPPTNQVVWKAAGLPRFLSELCVARDWAGLFSERETLLSLPAAGQVVNFSTTLSNLLGGMDFLNETLPSMGGPTRLIAARQDFSGSEVLPAPKLPAFALVTPLKDDAIAKMERRLFSGAQMALSILNLDMAQRALPTYLIDIDRYRGYRMLFSVFSDPTALSGMQMDAPPRSVEADDDEADPTSNEPAQAGIRYNFAPAVALVEGQFVIATSTGLLRDIIDAIADAKEQVGAIMPRPSAALDRLTIDADSLVRILRANRRELVVNRMLEEDQSKADAQRDIDIFLELVGYAQKLTASSERTGQGYRALLELSLRPVGAN